MASSYDLSAGLNGLRSETINEIVKQTAQRSYKMKQAFAINPTSSWTETFFRENPTTLTSNSTGNSVKGIPVSAAFPQMNETWERVQARIIKFGAELNIPWESILSSQINVQARNTIRLTEAVTKAVDDYLWDVLSDNRAVSGGSVILSYTIAAASGFGCWDETSASVIDNLMSASRKISDYNYDVSDLICFVSPYGRQSIMKWLADKGAQWMPIATGIAENGTIGKVAGITLIETPSVTASFALVCKPRTCATYNELVSIRSTTIEDPYKSLTIRVTEEGVGYLTDPKAICLIYNTQKLTAS